MSGLGNRERYLPDRITAVVCRGVLIGPKRVFRTRQSNCLMASHAPAVDRTRPHLQGEKRRRDPNAPCRVLSAQEQIKSPVARRGVQAPLLEGSVKTRRPLALNNDLPPQKRASVADHGAMWIRLMHTSAAAESIGEGKAQTSRYTGGRTFGNSAAASHARIDLRQSGSRRSAAKLNLASLARTAARAVQCRCRPPGRCRARVAPEKAPR